MEKSEFQRARTEEQRAARRAAILQVTRELVVREGLAAVSLNEIAREVGLAKSNVLRYFESREAILLTLLGVEYGVWADDVAQAMAEPARPGESGAERTARVVAATIMRRPLLCELLASAPTVLENNLSAEVARNYRQTMIDNSRRLLGSVSGTLGGFDRPRAKAFMVAVNSFIAMVWAAQHLSPGMARVFEESPELRTINVSPEEALREFLTIFLVGLEARMPPAGLGVLDA